ncbi:hypothetical protein Acsp04_50370 [Actinomadura sp. NBRC 104425]|nr:hypothetical protein Acsp04_50370 [Actinomadura sp. NBRC 104425]
MAFRPIARTVRMIRLAISPRFATSTDSNTRGFSFHVHVCARDGAPERTWPTLLRAPMLVRVRERQIPAGSFVRRPYARRVRRPAATRAAPGVGRARCGYGVRRRG